MYIWAFSFHKPGPDYGVCEQTMFQRGGLLLTFALETITVPELKAAKFPTEDGRLHVRFTQPAVRRQKASQRGIAVK